MYSIDPLHQGTAQRTRRGFSLVELLLVVSVISLLLAILLPTVVRSRTAAHAASCMNNLHHVYDATVMYSLSFGHKFPDTYTLGNFSFRMAPGRVTPGDPAALPEIFGWAAVLDRFGSMRGDSQNWVCPGAQPWMQAHGNTYGYPSTSSALNPYHLYTIPGLTQRYPRFEVMWDNYTMLPGLSGFRGPFNGYSIPTANRVYPHFITKNDSKATVGLYPDGSAALRAVVAPD